jgi:hypothetical protein
MEDQKVTQLEARMLARWVWEKTEVTIRDPLAVFYRLSPEDCQRILREQYELKFKLEEIKGALRRE